MEASKRRGVPERDALRTQVRGLRHRSVGVSDRRTYRDGIGRDFWIDCSQRQPLLQRLCDQQPVEWVAVKRCIRGIRGCRGAASLPLESPHDFLSKRRVQVIRNRERPGAEAKRSRVGLGNEKGTQLGDRTTAADHDEVFPCFNPVQQGIRISLELLQGDGTHVGIVAG
jgi:hypothetical protein